MKIGLHFGPGGNPSGVVDKFLLPLDAAGIPVFFKSTDSMTGLYDMQQLQTSVPHVGVYRTSVGDNCPSGNPDIPDYSRLPRKAAMEHWGWHKLRIPPELDKNKIWIETINEVDKNKAEWLAEFAIETAKLTMADGYKWLAFGWSAGEPEYEHWFGPKMTEFLQLCAANPDKLGVAVHEYSLDPISLETGAGYLLGRYRFILDANPGVKIFVTEFGWTYDTVPQWSDARDDYLFAGGVYGNQNVVGAATWYLGPGFGGIANLLNQHIEPLAQLIIEDSTPPPPPPPPPPSPPPPNTNALRNPSFEDGWYHPNGVPELQIPNQWIFGHNEGDVNPIDPHPFVRPEVRTLPKGQLPPDEQALFVLDGEYTLKAFKGYGAVNFWFYQFVLLEKGQYRFTAPVFADLVKGYVNGEKIWADDPQLRDGTVKININGAVNAFSGPLIPGQWNSPSVEFSSDGVNKTTILIEFILPFPLPQNGIFMDNLNLEKVVASTCDCPALSPRISVAIWTPPFSLMTSGEIDRVVQLAANGFDTPNGKTSGEHMICPSHADALEVHLAGEPGSILGIYLPQKIGTGVTIDWLNNNCPCVFNDGKRVVFIDDGTQAPYGFPVADIMFSQWFGANPQNYAQFGLPGHDGLDIPVPTGTDVVSISDGLVTVADEDPAGAFGKWVEISNQVSGDKLAYAHLSSVLVRVGDLVVKGQRIGLSGNTGNSTGAHLHLGLKKPGKTYVDPSGTRWPNNLHDPWLAIREEALKAYAAEYPAQQSGYVYASGVAISQDGVDAFCAGGYNFRDAPSTMGSLIRRTRKGEYAVVAGASANGYIPVILRTTPPPATSLPSFGLHMRADPSDLLPAEIVEQATLAPIGGAAKLLHSHPASAFHAVASAVDMVVIRVFQSWGGRNISPTEFFNWTKDELIDRVGICRAAGVNSIVVELHNEPNLVSEGLGSSWANGTEFSQWIATALDLFRGLGLPVSFCFPGLSPGGSVPGIRQDSTAFLRECAPVLGLFDFLGVHAYWSSVYPIDSALRHVRDSASFHGMVLVTECSRNDSGAPSSTYATEYAHFLRSAPAQVAGVFFFVSSGTSFQDESWVLENGISKGIAPLLVRELTS